jgi:GAF domain-containing protein
MARKPPTTRKRTAARKRAIASVDPKKEISNLRRELTRSRLQQSATADVLNVISRSTFDLQAVLDRLTELAARLCNADMAAVTRQDDGGFYHATNYNFPVDWVKVTDTFRIQPGRSSVVGRVLLEAKAVQIADVLTDPEYTYAEFQKVAGYRTLLGVPLLRSGRLIGVLFLGRKNVESFTDQQIELVSTFANQAVIAIENVRLFDEVQAKTRDLTESLQQQTATADVLKVISRSAFDLQTVLDTLVESAARLCQAYDSVVFLRKGEGLGARAHYGPIPMDIAEWPIGRKWVNGRAFVDRAPVHVYDLQASADEFPDGAEMALRLGHRTILVVPLLREDEAIGTLSVRRTEVKPFTEKQIELLTTFADQAVIAIENVRLFDEVQARTEDLRESLQQQTATADVLKVISRSAFDLQTVLDTLVESAVTLSGAKTGTIFQKKDSLFHLTAQYGYTAEMITYGRANPIAPGTGSNVGRTALRGKVVQIPDVLADPDFRSHGYQRIGNFRAMLGVPLMRDGKVEGVLSLAKPEPGPFTQRQVALVQTFADQAIIAIENVRLFDELQARTDDLKESLDQQTSTTEVLKVIGRSAFDLQPVFDTIAENAVKLCEAERAFIFRFDGNVLQAVASYNVGPEMKEWVYRNPVTPGRHSVSARAALERRTVQVPDVQADPEYDYALRDVDPIRTILSVPMLKGHDLVGIITIYRLEVKPFTDKQIALVETFADQAVIAIENVRLFDEVQARTEDLRESLQQQTATADVLKVISRSTLDGKRDLESVLETLLESAIRLCGATRGHVYRYDGEFLRFAAAYGAWPGFRAWLEANPLRPSRGSIAGRAALDLRVCHVPDVLSDTEYEQHELLSYQSFRSALCVPMLREGVLIGVIAIVKPKAEPFSEKQIELVSTFADQAVIAIENVRLFDEVQARTRELSQSVDELRALGEVSQAVNSTVDLETVLNTIVSKATQLSGTDAGAIYVYDQTAQDFHLRATYGMDDAIIAEIKDRRIQLGETAIGEAVEQRIPLQIPDIQEDLDSPVLDIIVRAGFRALLILPLLSADRTIGALVVRRKQPGEFPKHTVDLLQTFAAQSVLAIQNARLFENVEARTRELAQSLEELRTAQDRLIQTEKLASLGQLTAGIAHEIKNPLNFVNNFSALSVELVEELDDVLRPATLDNKTREETSELTQMLKGNLEKVVQHGQRADSIVKNMLLHSREGSGERRPVDLNAIVEDSLNLAYHGARAEKQEFSIRLERSFDPAAGMVDLFPQEITRVLLNLISNGVYAAMKRKAEMRDGYEPILAASTGDLGDHVEIRIRDNGGGIPSEVREKIFNPFFTTKPPGEGTGLGLSLSHDIVVKQHGGSIEVDTRPGEFTEFKIVLPRAAATSKAGAGA